VQLDARRRERRRVGVVDVAAVGRGFVSFAGQKRNVRMDRIYFGSVERREEDRRTHIGRDLSWLCAAVRTRSRSTGRGGTWDSSRQLLSRNFSLMMGW
jgi:hypothetical protein